MSEPPVASGLRRVMAGVGVAVYVAVVGYGLLVSGQNVWRGAVAPLGGSPARETVASPGGDPLPPLEGRDGLAALAEEEGEDVSWVEPALPRAVPKGTVTQTLAVSSAPSEGFVEGVPAGRQVRNLSCESQSAADLARYYGLKPTWEEILRRVGRDPGGNPHKGFVGSVDDLPGQLYPRGYGVYAEPIARALSEIGLPATVHYQQSDEWLRRQVAQGRPVMVWVTSGMKPYPVESWRAKDGTQVRAVRHEHTCLLVGYNEQGVWVIDPWFGQYRYYPWEVFLRSWDLLQRMSVVIER